MAPITRSALGGGLVPGVGSRSRRYGQLIVRGDGVVMLRNEGGRVVNQGTLSDGMVYWGHGKRSWFAREGPGVMIGDIDTNRHYYFRRSS